jgi:hypothetical protein
VSGTEENDVIIFKSHDKWLSMNKEVAYRKIMKITNRTHIQSLKINGLIK